MLKPSYSELMQKLNDDIDLNNQITSRYTIVIAAAKRARQIINNAHLYSDPGITDKAVSIAINEMSNGKIKLYPDGSPIDESELYGSPKKITITLSDDVDFSKDDDDSDVVSEIAEELEDDFVDEIDDGLDDDFEIDPDLEDTEE